MFVSKKQVRLLNLISGLLCQGLVAVSGLIIPNLILTTYGSVLNGLLATVTQILAYLSFVEMGLYSAALVSLYKPMAIKDYKTASSILAAVSIFYRKIAILFTVGVLICACIVPQIIKDDIPITTILLVLASLAGINIFNYLFLAIHKVVLQADDKVFVINFVHCIGIIVQFISSIAVIYNDINIAGVKAVIILANMVELMLLVIYIKKYLPQLTSSVEPQNGAIRQRKDILVHQISSLVLNNTDVILLMMFMPSLSYVSVYSIYAMVLLLVQNIVNTVISMYSSQAAQFYATGNYLNLYSLLKKYEIVFYIALFFCFSSMDILIMPFISIYTKEVTDAVYYIPIIGLLFSIYGIARMYRMPFSELTCAAGRYKETKIQAVNEAGINLVLSVALVQNLGIVGVLFGSIAGEVYRTIHTFVYCHKEIIPIFWKRSTLFGIINSGVFVLLHSIMDSFRIYRPIAYTEFFYLTLEVSLVILMTYISVNYLLYKATNNAYMKQFGDI